jgi:hypothetical protein
MKMREESWDKLLIFFMAVHCLFITGRQIMFILNDIPVDRLLYWSNLFLMLLLRIALIEDKGDSDD